VSSGRASWAALAALALLAGAVAGYHLRAGRAAPQAAAAAAEDAGNGFLWPPGAPLALAPRCDLVAYQGSQTALYLDRPYRTSVPVRELEGYSFCRSHRHGQEVWLVEVIRPTTFLTLASRRHQLEAAGWERLESAVRVDAAGVVLDGLYRRRVEPGRYAIPYGQARTANPVFWRPADTRLLLASPADSSR
jgi:hypothetical protein